MDTIGSVSLCLAAKVMNEANTHRQHLRNKNGLNECTQTKKVRRVTCTLGLGRRQPHQPPRTAANRLGPNKTGPAGVGSAMTQYGVELTKNCRNGCRFFYSGIMPMIMCPDNTDTHDKKNMLMIIGRVNIGNRYNVETDSAVHCDKSRACRHKGRIILGQKSTLLAF